MIRNTLFSFFFFTGIVVISILFLPSLMFPQKIVLFGGKLFGYWSSFCLKFFLNTKINIKGKENIISDTKFFIASSHQSMFETFFLQTIFNSPKFILKYELLKIPVFGWYLSKIGSISVNRNKISKDNIGLIDKIKNSVITSDRPIIIFPQGTRVKFGERLPFKKGAGRIYEALNLPCVPVALNTGKVWPKNSFLRFDYDINISFLDPIEPGLDKNIFIKDLEAKIYSSIEKLN